MLQFPFRGLLGGQTMFKRAIEEFGTVDILVNNAGIQSNAPAAFVRERSALQ